MNLPPMNPVPAMDLDQFSPGEKAVSIRACENFARLYGEAVREACARAAEDERVDAAATGDATDAAYNIACEQIAAAIRNGVIREGEGS